MTPSLISPLSACQPQNRNKLVTVRYSKIAQMQTNRRNIREREREFANYI